MISLCFIFVFWGVSVPWEVLPAEMHVECSKTQVWGPLGSRDIAISTFACTSFSLRLALPRSLSRPLALSLARPFARSLAPSLARPLARSLVRSPLCRPLARPRSLVPGIPAKPSRAQPSERGPAWWQPDRAGALRAGAWAATPSARSLGGNAPI